jgi:hypothetical protein
LLKVLVIGIRIDIWYRILFASKVIVKGFILVPEYRFLDNFNVREYGR